MDIARPLLTYILGFVALEVPRAGTDPQTSDEYVRRMWAFFAALPPGEFPHTVDRPPCWPGSPPRTSSSSASGPSWPASTPCNRNASTRPDPAQPQTAAASAFGSEPVDAAVTHAEWRCGRHLIAATGGAGRRSAKIVAAPMNQSREAHHPARPLHSP